MPVEHYSRYSCPLSNLVPASLTIHQVVDTTTLLDVADVEPSTIHHLKCRLQLFQPTRRHQITKPLCKDIHATPLSLSKAALIICTASPLFTMSGVNLNTRYPS